MRQKYKISAVRPSQGALDFSYLLDAPAGKHGFVTAKHGHFYFEDGARARFIGFNLAARSNTPDYAHAEKLAERFASLGVNVIRLHAADAPISDEPRSWASCRETPLLDYDRGSGRFFHTEGLDRFDYLVAKLKEKGIYLHIDLIVARNFVSGDELSYPGDAGNCVKCYPMFNERMIELQQEYARELLTHVNPYTGLTLVEDPAVMTVQINNEDSAIKGTMDSDWNPIMQPYRDEVRKRWNDFLLMKYSDREHLEKAWTWEGQCALRETEDPNAGTVEIVKGNFYQPANDPMGEWTGDVSPVRYADYMEFGIWQNRRFYQRMKAFLLSIGVRVPINASNLVAGAADVYGHIDGDVMENNSYFNHPLFPLTPDGYNVPGPSDYVKVNPLKIQTGVGSMATTILSLGSIAAVEGKPFLLSEWNEYGLNPFHSTSFMHTVAYACLNDWDGLILYNYQTSEKENEPEDEILSVFDAYNDPSLICQWGMMAEVFLKGLVAPAKHQADFVYTQRDLKTLPPMMAAPVMYLPYIMKMRNVFLDGDSYSGRADVAVNAGFVDSGKLEDAEHAVYYAWSDYVDACRTGKNPKRLKNAAKNSRELSESVHISEHALVFDKMRELAGSGDYEQFASYLDQALKEWQIIKADQGLTDGALVSDTGELTFTPDAGKFRIQTEHFSYFSGVPDEQIKLNDIVSVAAKNEEITLALLERRQSENQKEYLLTALGDTGMDETVMEAGPDLYGMPLTHVKMKGKLYINTLEGELFVQAKEVSLEVLNQEGDILRVLKGEADGDRQRFALSGEDASAQYRLIIS